MTFSTEAAATYAKWLTGDVQDLMDGPSSALYQRIEMHAQKVAIMSAVIHGRTEINTDDLDMGIPLAHWYGTALEMEAAHVGVDERVTLFRIVCEKLRIVEARGKFQSADKGGELSSALSNGQRKDILNEFTTFTLLFKRMSEAGLVKNAKSSPTRQVIELTEDGREYGL
jgi:hypothetical protein